MSAESVPRCPEGSITPQLFTDWYSRATQINAELFEEEHGRPPEDGEIPPLLPEQIAVNMEVLCNCVGSCVPGETTLCIDDQPGDRRFKAEVEYQSVQAGGVSGRGVAIPLTSLGVTRGGLFWFFAPDNPEVFIKILNGCAINGHYWIFWSAGTNVALTLNVSDTITDTVVTYSNPDLKVAEPVADTSAFSCN